MGYQNPEKTFFSRSCKPKPHREAYSVHLALSCLVLDSLTKFPDWHKEGGGMSEEKNKYLTETLPELKIDNIEIKREQSLKFLGVIIDENLNWKNHIYLLVSKI